jgi:hypothetical protein
MKNLTVYNQDTLRFFDDLLSSMNRTAADPNYKDRIAVLRLAISASYQSYDDLYDTRQLVTSDAAGHVNPERSDLLKLYSFQRKILQNLKIQLTTSERNLLINTCQNCTINEINSFDHLLPKEEFPEFAVNPKNLFPSCTQCNSYKGVNLRADGRPLFLNLYQHQLPDEQYLFVNVTITNIIETDYSVNNPNHIDHDLFTCITSHYHRLHLLERFKLNSHGIISELISIVQEMAVSLDQEAIRTIIRGKANRDKLIFGANYWKSILYLELANSDDFFDYVANI